VAGGESEQQGVSAQECLDQVRNRAFGGSAPSVTLSLDAIKAERNYEFLGEGKRYYDLRRWMDAAIEEAKPVYGCNVMMTSNQKDDFQKIVPIYNLPTVFSDKMYFWPIPTTELKRNSSLVQNPGWKYYD
ncbi:MAG: RagB/SusD family nutrient uptake outer membrane protein, partial [Muribaculaceae bacterium]|nr:RagB/SusD family nutrient uptake outer membrane protein [Muribaculaceae bacterium]